MKFLIHSNGPTIGTGYGVQTRHLADRLASDGHEVAISCTYGHQGQMGEWTSPHTGNTIRLYPSGYEVNSTDVLVGHAEHWFEGDPKAGWIILLLDVWIMQRPLLMDTLREFQVVSWCPVDHFPAPPGVLKALQGMGAVPLAMSRYGRDQLTKAGLQADYAPLAVDTNVYKPTYEVQIGDETMTARQFLDISPGAFVVGMVAMNKGWAKDRKGFGEAFQAFGRFWQNHQHAVLLVHSEKHGAAEGIDLEELAAFSAIPPHAIKFTDQYAYRFGFPPDKMAAVYTAMDVLLSPSRGEGFCVPLIEAQACGVPVIASDFTAQTELVGAGWTVDGQLDWDPSQHAWFKAANVSDIIGALNACHEVEDWAKVQESAVSFASHYDWDRVFDTYWRPFIATLEPPAPIEREPFGSVDVIVPVMRLAGFERLIASMAGTTGGVCPGKVIAVHDGDAWLGTDGMNIRTLGTGKEHTSYAEKVNLGVRLSTADAVLIVGDDTTFTPGWYDALVAASVHGDVIGTNDSEPGRVRNPNVAAGRHADHFAIRRSYIDDEGSSLDGPGLAMSEQYPHWYVDREVIELAKARGVYYHAHDCRIIHHHPGYDGDEAAREADPVYMRAVATREESERIWRERAPLIEFHRVTRVAA